MNHLPALVIDLAELTAADLPRAGGKAVALGRLAGRLRHPHTAGSLRHDNGL